MKLYQDASPDKQSIISHVILSNANTQVQRLICLVEEKMDFRCRFDRVAFLLERIRLKHSLKLTKIFPNFLRNFWQEKSRLQNWLR